MMKQLITIALVSLLAAMFGGYIGGLVSGNQSAVGGSTSDDWTVANLISNGDVTAADDLVVTDDATISGGSLTVTTSNTATSTLIVGCIQFYATSTATAHKFMASTTPGAMYSVYGTCP